MLGRWKAKIISRRSRSNWRKYTHVLLRIPTSKHFSKTIESILQTMLALIYDRLTRQVFDDVMEVAWSTMWNVTDETAINCERFLDGHGMQYFLDCLKVCGSLCSAAV